MKQTNPKLAEFNIIELINELTIRGVYTNLIYSIYDIDMQLDNINEDRNEDDQIVLTENDKINILKNVFNTDYYMQEMNEELDCYILDNYTKN
jgi:hypothetical protein